MGWSVSLNVKEVEREEQTFWKTILKRIQDEVGWSRYAVVYDNLLLEFEEYGKLIKLVADQVGSAARCIDLGAGTGNTTLHLLESDPEREVWYVEINETMLRHFRAKLKSQHLDYGDRLTIIKDNIIRLDKFPPSSFDAAIMTNVLYAIDDREECLRNVNRILKTGASSRSPPPIARPTSTGSSTPCKTPSRRKTCSTSIRNKWTSLAHDTPRWKR